MTTRRHVLKAAGAWSAMLAMGRASAAQTPSDYKALVCVFLNGGNDAYNTVLRTDSTSWANYTTVRNQEPSPIRLLAPGTAADTSKSAGSPERLGGVLALSPVTPVTGQEVALHPNLGRLQALFNVRRKLAIVSNVGPLIQPLTKEQVDAINRGSAAGAGLKLPAKLYSHNDQQNTWMALGPEGRTQGWGGQLVDGFTTKGNTYSAVSLGGNAVWLSGQDVRQYQMGVNGAIALGGSSVYGSTKVADALKRIASYGLAGNGATGQLRGGHALMADLGTIGQRSINGEASVTTAFAALPVTDTRIGPNTRLQYTNVNGGTVTNPLAQQLQAVARMIGTRSALGLGSGRQVFFVQMGGFDTHDNQNASHADLMAKLDHALGYFYECLEALGMHNQVTTFTMSDFGRTFTSNGDGTDHGWGSHQFVMGGAVSGGTVYGRLPTYGVKSASSNAFDSPDQLGNGVMLPSTSLDQYGATLASWFGASQPGQVFSNLANFSVRNLGFV